MATEVELTSLPPAINVDPERERLLREAEKELPLEYGAGWHDAENYVYKSGKGLSREIVEMISRMKSEPEWMTERRIKAYEHFLDRRMPGWGADLSTIDFDDIHYYIKPTEGQGKTWDDVPADIKNTFDRLGIPEAERKFLAGVSAQYESEVVYHSIKEDLEKQGVIFTDMDSGLREHPELVKKYFGTVVPYKDNKFAALNTAVWSGGSFVYVPKGVHVAIPLQAYFRINAKNAGQFERTLIVAEEGSYVHYIEGCTAPIWSEDSLHSAVVELIAHKGATLRYTTVQNWSNNVYNIVTKRAIAYENATVAWIDGNLGSKVTMKYPAVYLLGPGAKAEIVSAAFANSGQVQDAGGKVWHCAPNTTSTITSKSVTKGSGRAEFRGWLKIYKGCKDSVSAMRCDAMLLDKQCYSGTTPVIEVDEEKVALGHEASVSKVGEEELFYLQSRGLTEREAITQIVNGFLEPFTKTLPMEYAVELNRLIQLQMDAAVG
ncbi:MAG TPA: Fe-S cluster assembly protein SufB [Chloroflexota bacterium]|jgi:Fe-S cluster assembly protein SufB|nr:Fe-S cluster assembly protein SufB [Chloroflexota bacterium]